MRPCTLNKFIRAKNVKNEAHNRRIHRWIENEQAPQAARAALADLNGVAYYSS